MKLEASDIQPGDELYVSDVWSIDNGWSDQCGGIAVVERIQRDSYGNVFVHFKGLEHHAPNLKHILEEQEKWEKEYGDRLAHDCPEGTKCPNPRRPCQACNGRKSGCVACNWTGTGIIKKSATQKFVETVNGAKSSAFRSKLLRQSRREIDG
jgi:hypothetical protein